MDLNKIPDFSLYFFKLCDEFPEFQMSISNSLTFLVETL